ncbi:MAG: pyruvate kinase [Bacteroidales bacterium]|jgi:pyruvate kinase|nr:pyruvate kinase [Bacteroidales bacterium]
MDKKTKIVATISEFTGTEEYLSQLFDAGVNVVRLNSAHQSLETAVGVIKNIRKINPSIAILIDTKGPEVRTSSQGTSLQVKKGDEIKIKSDPEGKSGGDVLYVNYGGFYNDVFIDDVILINDGEISMTITKKDNQILYCKIEDDGEIKPKKGVNAPNVKLHLPAISEKDKIFIDFAIKHKLDYIAHSFVQHADDVCEIRKILQEKDSKIKIISKIENQIGVDNIAEIIEVSDGIMVARGDLGIEIAAEKIPVIQRMLIKSCIKNNKMVIIATQMLHSMITNPRPTRAEVNDVATAVYEKADALMLSGETATGNYPIQSVEMMSKIIKEVELATDKYPPKSQPLHDDVLSVLSHSAVLTCNTLPIKAIIVDTLTGRTARFLSAYRGKTPVYAFCYNEYAMRQLALTYGVKAFMMELSHSRDNFLRRTIKFLIKEKTLIPSDTVVVIGGSFGMANGASFMEISTAQNLLDYPIDKT